MKARRTRNWVAEHASDTYVKKANTQGLRSRAVFKLEQIDQRDRLLKPGCCVVDLGATPGGWAQYAARRVGPKGCVVALDMLPMQEIPGVVFLQADAGDPETHEQVLNVLDGRPCKLVLSDMAPNMSGIRLTDQARCEELADVALAFADRILAADGDMLMKSFQAPGLDKLLREFRSRFAKTVVRKPDASRAKSRELYLLGRQYSV